MNAVQLGNPRESVLIIDGTGECTELAAEMVRRNIEVFSTVTTMGALRILRQRNFNMDVVVIREPIGLGEGQKLATMLIDYDRIKQVVVLSGEQSTRFGGNGQ